VCVRESSNSMLAKGVRKRWEGRRAGGRKEEKERTFKEVRTPVRRLWVRARTRLSCSWALVGTPAGEARCEERTTVIALQGRELVPRERLVAVGESLPVRP